jgi:hypothetical protein
MFIIERFLALCGLKIGPIFIRMDQACELWRSNQLREVATTSGCAMGPTGSDAASKNGKVKRPKGTSGVMTCCLHCSAGLSAIFWYDVLVYEVYLKNRMYHNALRQTLYEAWTGDKPPFAHIHNVGSLVIAHKPGKRPAKADHPTSHGILLGYGATPKMSAILT